MPQGFVDAATVVQVAQCLDRGQSGQYTWSLRSAIKLTTLLMGTNHLALAPGLAPPVGIALDHQDRLTDLMLEHELVERLRHPEPKCVASAITNSKKWVGREATICKIRAEVERLVCESADFDKWIEWVVARAWVPHAIRQDGLFDKTYLRYVSRVLCLSDTDTHDLHERSKDKTELERLAKAREKDFVLMTKAYVTSIIIRGRYHEELAQQQRIQLIQHPLRMISKRRTGAQTTVFPVTNSMRALSYVVLYGAMKQRRQSQRLDSWVMGIKKVRGILNRGAVQLGEGTGSASVAAALNVAKQAEIDVTNRDIDIFFELLGSFGAGTLSSLCLSPWIGIPLGVGVGISMKKLGPTRQLRNTLEFHIHGRRLRDIAAGRIESEWLRDV